MRPSVTRWLVAFAFGLVVLPAASTAAQDERYVLVSSPPSVVIVNIPTRQAVVSLPLSGPPAFATEDRSTNKLYVVSHIPPAKGNRGEGVSELVVFDTVKRELSRSTWKRENCPKSNQPSRVLDASPSEIHYAADSRRFVVGLDTNGLVPPSNKNQDGHAEPQYSISQKESIAILNAATGDVQQVVNLGHVKIKKGLEHLAVGMAVGLATGMGSAALGAPYAIYVIPGFRSEQVRA
jgi:hypothetical protein